LGLATAQLSHSILWRQTAIIVTTPTSAIVISPYAKRGYLGHRHLSTASITKTEEELLGLPPLALSDLLATDLSDLFGTGPILTPFIAVPEVVPASSAERPGP